MVRFACATLFVLSSCSPVVFGTELKGEAVVPGNPLGPPLAVFPSLGGLNDLDFNANREFQNQKVTRAGVVAVAVEAATIKILSPSDQTFAFLSSIQLVARAADKEAVFAEKSNIGDILFTSTNPTLALDLTTADLTPFVTAPLMSVVLRGKGGSYPAKDTRLEVKVKLRVAGSP